MERRARRLGAIWREIQWPVVACLWLLTIALGYFGYRQHWTDAAARAHRASSEGPREKSPLDILYITLELFKLDWSVSPEGGVVPFYLDLARFLAPTVTAYTAFQAFASLLREEFQILRLRFLSNHVVVCGLGRKGSRLAQDFLDLGERLVAIEKDEHNDEIASCREQGAIVLIGNAKDSGLLRKARVQAAKHLIVTCGDDVMDIEIAVRGHRLVQGLGTPARTSSRAVNCLVHVADATLRELMGQDRLFSGTETSFKVGTFNAFLGSARQILREHPLDREGIGEGDPWQVHLFAVGFGRMGESVVLQAARMGEYANRRRLKVTVVDKRAGELEESFRVRFGQFDRVCDAEFLDADIESPVAMDKFVEIAEGKDTFLTVVVCLEDDVRGLSCGLRLSSLLKGIRNEGNRRAPVLVRVTETEAAADLLQRERTRSDWAGDVFPFGSIDEACRKEIVLDEPRVQDRLAERIHASQVRMALAVEPDRISRGDPALRPWSETDECYRESSRQQADHIPVKLSAIGCRACRRDGVPPGVSIHRWKEDEIELLARMEHSRWMAERSIAGWTAGERSTPRKTHPYLVEWEALEEKVRDYDRNFVRLIPEILDEIEEVIIPRHGEERR